MPADIFDPAELETEELLPPVKTPENAHRADTLGDPEGSEARATEVAIALPDFFFRRYRLDDLGKPTFNKATVDGIMAVYAQKADTNQVFGGKDPKAEEKYFNKQIDDIVTGISQLLEIDPQTTGITMLQLTTRTWAEFVSIAYEYQDSMATVDQNKEIPDWLIEREAKMIALGRKARMLSGFCAKMDDKFGLKSTSLDSFRVQGEVERRLQRLAEWNFNQHANTSGKTANTLNTASNKFQADIFNNA